MGQDKRNSGDYQRAVGEMVDRHVIYGVSALVFQIGNEKLGDWHHLFSQDDWETPVGDYILQMPLDELREAAEKTDFAIDRHDNRDTMSAALLHYLHEENKLQEFCEEHNLDPQQTEIYEHWIVSEWLADKLEKRGEVIERDFYGLTIWGRACTGQAIILDSVICAIYDELHVDPQARPKRIAELNDLCRTAMGVAGRLVQTCGINALPEEDQSAIREKVETFDDFNPGNDPHGERDFGSFTHKRKKIYFKIDYYAPDMEHGSEDPADPQKTVRVLTIMFADEY